MTINGPRGRERSQPMSLENVRYDAFISYRHCELDSFISENLHKKLESYKMPSSVAKKLSPAKQKIERIFRDEAELPLSGNLSDPITVALNNSEFLIVICTPRLPESQWCQKEIETFVKTHDRDHVLLVLAEGEPEESFPKILMSEERTVTDQNGNSITVTVDREPLAADCRGSSNKERLKKLDNVVLKLCAAIFSLNYDDLRQRHRERQVRQRIIAASVAFSIVTLFAITCLFFMIRISRQNKVIADKYAGAMADASAALLSEGLIDDSLYTARSVLPGKSSDGYNADAYYSLCKTLAPYEVANCYYPTGEFISLQELYDADVFPDLSDEEIPEDIMEAAGISDYDDAVATESDGTVYLYYEETSMTGDTTGTIVSIDMDSKRVINERTLSGFGYYRLIVNPDDHSLLLSSDRMAYMLDEDLQDIEVITGFMDCLCVFAYDNGFVILDRTGTMYTAGLYSNDEKTFELYGHEPGTFVSHAVYDSKDDRLMVHFAGYDKAVIYEGRGMAKTLAKDDVTGRQYEAPATDTKGFEGINDADVFNAVTSDDGKYIAVYTNDGTLHMFDSKTDKEIKTLYSYDSPLVQNSFAYLDTADVYILGDKVFDRSLNMISPLPEGAMYAKDDDGKSIYISSRFDDSKVYRISIIPYEKMIENADSRLGTFVPDENIKSRYSIN